MEGTGQIFTVRGGFYDVSAEKDIIRCRARGKFRKEGVTPLVGDYVRFRREADLGYIEALLPRKNALVRPAVANIDVLIMLAAAVNPVTQPWLIDRTAAAAAQANVSVLLLLNKCDMDPADELYAIYSRCGIPTYRISAATGEGIDAFYPHIQKKVCVFSGNSGVGKSTLLNALYAGAHAETGAVSEKLGRGRHTTRHTELYYLPDGTGVVDTPGFSAFDIGPINLSDEKTLKAAFPEMAPYLGKCRFDDCTHRKEEGCAVSEAVRADAIALSRYESYVCLRTAWEEREEWAKTKER